jgi:hypothetical protein
VWVVGCNPVDGGDGIYRWNGTGWLPYPGGAVSISVDAGGSNPWVTNNVGQIYRWTGSSWLQVPGCAHDIGARSAVEAWAVGCDPVDGGYGIYGWNGTGWVQVVPGGAVRIDVDDATGGVYVTNNVGAVYYNITSLADGWIYLGPPTCGLDIASGTTIWVVGCNPVDGGYGIYAYLYLSAGPGFFPEPGGAVRIGVNAILSNGSFDGDQVWVVNSFGQIFLS